MIGLENLSPEIATDLIGLVNSLQKLQKSCNVKYNVLNKKTNQWSTKELSLIHISEPTRP